MPAAVDAAANTPSNPPPSNVMPSSSVQSSPSRPSPVTRKANGLPLPAYPTPPAPWQTTASPHGGGPASSVNGVSPVGAGGANGIAGGKTGQVIERLTSENDRLKRELRSEQAAKDEAQLELRAMKSRIAYLEEQNTTISYQYDINEAALARKERRIDDLKATIEEEARRRRRAEDQSSEMGKRLGETVAGAAREVAEAREARKMAEVAAETLDAEYRALDGRMRALRRDWLALEAKMAGERDGLRRQLCRLEVVLDQQRQRQEKSDETVAELSSLVASYRATEENVKKLETDMAKTVVEMRWVMRLHKAREEAGESQQ